MLTFNRNRLAKLQYLPGTYRMVSAGDHVMCAVSGVEIPLEDLRYWSVARQEAYASSLLSAQAELGAAAVAGR